MNADVPVRKQITEWRCEAEGRAVFLRLEDGTRLNERVQKYVMVYEDRRVRVFDTEEFEDAKRQAMELLAGLVRVDQMRQETADAEAALVEAYSVGTIPAPVLPDEEPDVEPDVEPPVKGKGPNNA